jgi:hypothetical protein
MQPSAGRAQGYPGGAFTPRHNRQELAVNVWAAKEAQGYVLPRSTFTHVSNQDRVKPWTDGLQAAAEARATELRGASPDWGGRRALPPLSPRQSLLSTLVGGETLSAVARMPAGLHSSPERNFGTPREFVPHGPRVFAGRTYNTFAQRFRVRPPGREHVGGSARANPSVPSKEGRRPLPLTAGKTGWSRSDHRF